MSSPLVVLSPADALPSGVPRDRCGTLSNPQPNTLCYTVTPGGGKVNAGGGAKTFPAIIIQATEPEYVIADVIIEITSDAGDRDLPSVNQLSPEGEASIVSVAKDKLRELRQIRSELQAKATVLSGPALIEAQAKLSTLQEEERIYEKVVTTTTAAGQDAGKFQVSNASARSRKCGFANLDTCGSWGEYNVYAVKRYVGNPIAAYNRPFAVAQDAQNTITRLVESSQETINPPEGLLFGAIGIGQVGNKRYYGWSSNSSSLENATNLALSSCGQTNCEAYGGSNGFTSIAVSDDFFWGIGTSNSANGSRDNASKFCRQSSGVPDTCQVVLVIDHKNGVVFKDLR